MKVATRYVCLLALAAGGSITFISQLKSARPSHRSAPHLARPFQTARPARREAAAALHGLPLSFEPNVGQARQGVEFIGRGQGSAVLLTSAGLVFDVGGPPEAGDFRLRLTFGASCTSKKHCGSGYLTWRGGNRIRGKTNYFIGSDPNRWRANVPHYESAEAVISHTSFSGAETKVKVHGGVNGLEYDLRVPPGTDPEELQLHLTGARRVRLDSSGNLRMQVGATEVVMLKPLAYEEIQQAAPRYTIPHARTRARGPKVRKHRSENPTAHARRQRRTRMRNKIRGGNARPPRLRHPRSDAPRRQHRPTRQSVPAPASFPPPRKPVEGGFILEADGSVGFRVGPYDTSSTLVIDPSISISYSTFLGGTGSDAANSLAVDSSGDVYIGGTTTSATTFSETPVTSEGPGGATDIFIAKIDPTQSGANSLVYLTFLGGSGNETGGLIAVDSKGDMAVTGTTASDDFPTTDKSLRTSGTNDAFVAELDPMGSKLLYSTMFGGNGTEDAQSTGGIALDSSGRIYVAGDTSSTDLKVTAGAFESTYGGGISDGFLAVFQPSASAPLEYCTYLGIQAQVGAGGVAVDAADNAYLAGFTTNPGTTFPAKGAFQSSYAGDPQDAFLIKLSPVGNGQADLVYATLLGGSGMDEAYAVAVDTSTPPKAYVTGTTASTDFPANGTIAGYQTTFHLGARANAFLSVVALNATTGMTSLAYSTYLGGSETDAGEAIYIAAPNEVYLTGATASFDFPWHDNLEPYNGASDAFVTKMDPTSPGSASLIYSTPLGGISPPGGSATASAAGIAASLGKDGVEHVYVAGQTTAGGFPSGGSPVNGLQLVCESCQASPPEPDAFVVEFGEGSAEMPSVYFNAANLNFGAQPVGSTNVPPQGGAIYNGGQIALVISNLGIAGLNARDFSLLSSGDCVNASINPGDFCSFGVGFIPTQVGPEAATVVVTDNAPGSPQSFEIIGMGAGPLASFSATSLSFGNQPTGSTSPSQVITITNTGNQTLVIAQQTLAGANPAEFALSGPAPPAGCAPGGNVAAGASCVVDVDFAPTSTGPANAQLDVFDNSGGVSGAEQVVALTGTGIPPGPIAYLLPTSITYGTQAVGTTSAVQVATLKNTGNTGLNLTGITITGSGATNFAIQTEGTNPCPILGGTLVSGVTCTVGVAFSPIAGGAQSANLSFADDAPGSPQTIALSGTANQPTVQIAPSSVAFPAQSVGTTSAATTVTLTNSGTTALTMNGISIAGTNAGDFAESDNCNAGKSLGGGASCQVNVTFQPTATGSRAGTLDISDNAAGSPQSVALSGTATQAGIQLQPASVNFGSVTVQTTSSPVPVTVTNTGNGALAFKAIGLTGTNSAEFAIQPGGSNNCAGTNVSVAPNGTCTVNVTFTPACSNTTAAISGTLSFTDNAPASPQTISLTGTASGNFCVTGLAPQSVAAGGTATYSLNASAVNGYVGSVALSVAGCPPNASCNVTPASVSVVGNAETPFSVQVVTQSGAAAGATPIWLLPWGLLLVLTLAGTVRPTRSRYAFAAASLALVLLMGVASCGAGGSSSGGGGDPTTPPGSYQMTLAGMANGSSQTTTLNLTVTP
jgi:Abnormal spindle-like microcephaly-assoc'd, ASPM-SPD-2-Hydin/Beta-propeller repeat